MESTENIGSSVDERKDMNETESAEDLLGKRNSLDCSASRLVQAIDISQHQMATTSGLSDCDSQIPSNEDVSVEESSGPKELELMDVNDDCLSAIFKRLPMLDLISVADVCHRFRSIAQENFWLTKTIVKVPQDVCKRMYKLNEDIAEDENDKVIQRSFRLFRNFGLLMTELDVERNSSVPQFEEKIIVLIMNYCSENLTTLNLDLRRLQCFPMGMKSIIGNLKKLDLWSLRRIDPSVYEWLTVVEDLTLETEKRKISETFFARTFDGLNQLTLGLLFIEGTEFATFLNNNGTVKHVYLDYVHLDDVAFEFPARIETLRLHLLGDSLENIDNRSFGRMKNLKSLDICLYGPEPPNIDSEATEILREIIAGDIPLKHLALEGIALNMSMESRRLCDYLSKLVHLKTFTLAGPVYENLDEIKQLSPKLHRVSDLRLSGKEGTAMNVDDMVAIVNSFPNLQRLRIWTHKDDADGTVVFETKSFERIVKIVQSRNNNTRLDIELTRGYKPELPNDLVQRHRHLLRVKELHP